MTGARAWLSEERVRVYPLALLVAVALGFSARLASPGSVGAGGDFKSFYSAGEIVRSGQLYDWSAQGAAQNAVDPRPDGEFLPFAYPPFVALAYVPLSGLDFRLAYGLHTVGMAFTLYLAVLLLAPLFPRMRSRPLAIFVALLAFYPMLRAVGGQVTPVGVLLVALAWRCLRAERDVAAGAAIGLLLYKPQFALPFICLAGLLRRPRILVGFTGAATLLYVAGAATNGWSWPLEWWSHAIPFQRAAQQVDSHQSIGLLGFAEALIGVGSPAAIGIGVLFSAALAVWMASTWLRSREPLNLRMGTMCCALVLLPPHSLYYDAGFAGLGLLVLADECGWKEAWWIGILFLAAYLAPFSEIIGFSPLFPIVVATLLRLRVLAARGTSIPLRLEPGSCAPPLRH